MHIAIEGMDGVGKSTIGKLLAERLGFLFVEKPLKDLFDEEENIKKYQMIARKVNSSSNRTFTAWFYGLSNIYVSEKYHEKNIVTDRHIVSNYCWSGTKSNEDIYDMIINKIGKPTLTIILYASPQIIKQRLQKRDTDDKDLLKVNLAESAYEKMIYFCEKKQFNYFVVDTTHMDIDMVIRQIMNKIGGLKID